MQGHLDAALRSSSAANEDADVLRRVDVRLPPGKVLEGDLGWDIFSLQYLVDGPMRAVLSPDAMSGGRDGMLHVRTAWRKQCLVGAEQVVLSDAFECLQAIFVYSACCGLSSMLKLCWCSLGVPSTAHSVY